MSPAASATAATDLLAQAYAAHLMTRDDEDKANKKANKKNKDKKTGNKNKKVVVLATHPIKQRKARDPASAAPDAKASDSSSSLGLGSDPAEVFCPDCGKMVVTETFDVYDGKAYLTGATMAAMGLCLLAWVPFCLDRFQSIEHTCPDCQRSFGVFKPDQD